jgi:hypothetical protein
MFLKQRKASTDPRLRSLLQKATRRGYVDLVELVAHRLFEAGDKTWLRSRAAVITFEECWPLAERLDLQTGALSKVRALKDVASSVKQKDAAGLGALAYAHHESDKSVERSVTDARSIRIVSEALDRPTEFFGWATSKALGKPNREIVESAQKYLAAATWGWDKTCILAGAYMAAVGPVPSIAWAEESTLPPFPFWVALDKHTPEGKEALRKVCGRIGASYRQVIWAGFYFESARTNRIAPSPWWDMEKAWRLQKAGLTIQGAEALWLSVRGPLEDELRPKVEELKSLVNIGSQPQAELLA